MIITSLIILSSLQISITLCDPKDILSDEFIDKINEKQTLWKAGRNFHKDTPWGQIQGLLGVTNIKNRLPVKEPIRNRMLLPTSFDSRKQWKNCPSLTEIRDQSTCGSCWAFATVEVITDRICIHSNGKKQVTVSAADLITCCKSCGYGCRGGEPATAFEYWVEQGIVSGGGYGSNQGCKPYFFPPCEHYKNGTRPTCGPYKATPKCERTCNGNSSLAYRNDLTFGKDAYTLRGEENIRQEILQNGPVVAAFTVYADFLHYQSGIYKHVEGEMLGGHAVKIIGWGEENNVPYWLIANSWNEDWGEHGYFKMLRGNNECAIESGLSAGLPKL